MKWKNNSVREKGYWTDYIDEAGRLMIAQGYNEYERKDGRPYCLFDVSDDRHWKILGFFSTVEEAKKAAEPAEAIQKTA